MFTCAADARAPPARSLLKTSWSLGGMYGVRIVERLDHALDDALRSTFSLGVPRTTTRCSTSMIPSKNL
jgi:hypothetical protein